MQINSLSTLDEICVFGTQIASMVVKGDIRFPYAWQYIISYFCLNVEYDLQGCLCHLRFKSCFQKWHCAVLVSFPVRIRPLNLLGSLEYVAVLLNLPLSRVSILSPQLFLGCVCLIYQWRGWATVDCWEAARGIVGEPWGGKDPACLREESLARPWIHRQEWKGIPWSSRADMEHAVQSLSSHWKEGWS